MNILRHYRTRGFNNVQKCVFMWEEMSIGETLEQVLGKWWEGVKDNIEIKALVYEDKDENKNIFMAEDTGDFQPFFEYMQSNRAILFRSRFETCSEEELDSKAIENCTHIFGVVGNEHVIITPVMYVITGKGGGGVEGLAFRMDYPGVVVTMQDCLIPRSLPAELHLEQMLQYETFNQVDAGK